MAKNTLNLSDVIAYAKANNLDASDLDACKQAYRLANKARKEERAYHKRIVSMCIIIPQGKNKEPKVLSYHGLDNKQSTLLALAFSEASKNIIKDTDMKSVQVIVGECINLLDAINNTKA